MRSRRCTSTHRPLTVASRPATPCTPWPDPRSARPSRTSSDHAAGRRLRRADEASAVGRKILLSGERASQNPLSPRREHTELGSGQRISPIGRQGPLDHQDDHVSKHSSRCQSSMLRQHDDDAHKFAKWLYHLATWLEGAEPPSASSCALHPRLERS